MNKSLTRAGLPLLMLGLMYTSCKKDDLKKTTEQHSAKQLQVMLNDAYMPGQLVDSALAVWEGGGTKQTIPMVRSGNKLTASFGKFNTEGTGILTVQLFTQTKMDGIPLQWEKRFAYVLDRKKALSLSAPANIQDAGWYPRAICKSDIHENGFVAIIALKPEDTYFELQGVHPELAKRIEVVRRYYTNDTANLVASQIWQGSTQNLDAKGNLINRSYFSQLPTDIGNRAWERFKVRAIFYKNIEPRQTVEAAFVHNKL